MINEKQHDSYAKYMELENFLIRTIEWINHSVTNVEDVFTAAMVKRHVRENWKPEDVYSTETLEEWAEYNGYVRKD